MDRGVLHEEVVQVGGGECRRLGMTGGVVCSYCLAASKTKPEARREGEESIHVADKGTFSVSHKTKESLLTLAWRENVCIYTNVFDKPDEQRLSLLRLCQGET